jgi:hypothetical protein
MKRKASYQEGSSPKAAKVDERFEANLSESLGGKLVKLREWLVHYGAVLDGLELQESHGGIGVFTTRKFEPKQVCLQLPQKLALTLKAAQGSDFGLNLARCGASDPLLLWMYIALGRVDKSHFWHPYLSCLPDISPDPLCWPPSLQSELKNTDVGMLVQRTHETLKAEYSRVCSKLEQLEARKRGHQLESYELKTDFSCPVSWDLLLWARGMHQSRCFPAILSLHNDSKSISIKSGPDGSTIANESCFLGCLLPMLDFTNHSPRAAVCWTAENGVIKYRCHEALQSGCQVWNNYGPKANGSLLFFHGFALPNNPYDIVELSFRAECRNTGTLHCLHVAMRYEKIQLGPDAALMRYKELLLKSMGLPVHLSQVDFDVACLGSLSRARYHRKIY